MMINATVEASELARQIVKSMKMCKGTSLKVRNHAYKIEVTRLQNTCGISHSLVTAIRNRGLVIFASTNIDAAHIIFSLFTQIPELTQAVEEEFENYCTSYSCTLNTKHSPL